MEDFPLHDVEEDLDSVALLLVDDQPMIGEAVRRILITAQDVAFYFCTESNKAISEAQRIRPTVILQDLVMPGTDGLTLLKQYRSTESTRSIPVIALSTKEDPNVKSRALKLAQTTTW